MKINRKGDLHVNRLRWAEGPGGRLRETRQSSRLEESRRTRRLFPEVLESASRDGRRQRAASTGASHELRASLTRDDHPGPSAAPLSAISMQVPIYELGSVLCAITADLTTSQASRVEPDQRASSAPRLHSHHVPCLHCETRMTLSQVPASDPSPSSPAPQQGLPASSRRASPTRHAILPSSQQKTIPFCQSLKRRVDTSKVRRRRAQEHVLPSRYSELPKPAVSQSHSPGR